MYLAKTLTVKLTLLPFVEYLWKHGRRVLLPSDNKARLLGVAHVLDVAQYQHPTVTKIFVELTTGA